MAVVGVVLMAAAALPSAADNATTTTVSPPTTPPPSSESTTTTTPASTEPTPSTISEAEEQRRKAEATGNLNAALAADSEIAAQLLAINTEAQATQSRIDEAEEALEEANETLDRTAIDLARAEEDEAEATAQLRVRAVEGFVNGVTDPGPFLFDGTISESLRQTALLETVNRSTADLIEDTRRAQEDGEIARAEARQAALDATRIERELNAELEILREQELIQLSLRAEARTRISRWESELTAYAAEDQAIQDLIAESGSSEVAPQPREPSVLGFQWPVIGPVTSGYGYRIHPVFGTRKLHSGIDVAAPRNTPISATGNGVVIYVGWRGGYGNTVIVDHGAGLTSLYAHMTDFAVANGDTVERGDVVGFVGATGTATGNHLHFEIRYNGTPADPAPYLP